MIMTPPIRTERLTLRPLEMSDLETTHQYARDIDNTQFMIFLPNRTIQETNQFLQRVVDEWRKDVPSFYEFAIIHQTKHIGAVSVWLDESGQEGELGWILHKAHQGKGYASEAARAILDFAVHRLKVKKVVAHCDARNLPSCRVMQKIGLSLERDDGVRRYKDSEEEVPELMYSFVVGKEDP